MTRARAVCSANSGLLAICKAVTAFEARPLSARIGVADFLTVTHQLVTSPSQKQAPR